MSAENRVRILLNQIAPNPVAAKVATGKFDPAALTRFLDNDNHEYRKQIVEKMASDPLFKPQLDLDVKANRDLTFERLKKSISWGIFDCKYYVSNPKKFMAFLEALGWCNYSLAIKVGVHFTLCGGTLCSLGTAKHIPLVERLTDGSLPGSFSMTELGHGSNVMGIETTATYDKATQEFVIHTPTDSAQKFWIGDAAQDGKLTVVFAWLITPDGQNHGIHVFAVRLRDDEGKCMPGVRIADNGTKMGLNGVDNGRIWFQNVRVPRDALLDKYGQVSADGAYKSAIEDSGVRFATMISGLVCGRILIGTQALNYTRLGLKVAIQYGHNRRQFGPKGNEVPIISYGTHQRRLYPALATTVALTAALNHCKELYASKKVSAKQVHVLVSGLKAWSTWHSKETLNNARECCGGQGFAAHNQIGPLICDTDVATTFEGDNTVLMQQISKDLLASSKRADPKAARAQLAKSKPALIDFSQAAALEPSALLALLKYREQALLFNWVSHMAALQQKGANGAKGLSADKAYGATIDLALEVAWASLEYSVANLLAQAVLRARHDGDAGGLSGALRRLWTLHVLYRLERAALPFLLTQGLVDAEGVDALRQRINAECADWLRSGFDLQALEGLGVPEYAVYAPIAKANYLQLHPVTENFGKVAPQ